MKTLDIQNKMEFGRAAVAVLRALQITDRLTTYKQFAKAIGLMADDETRPARHRTLVRDILDGIAAVERLGGKWWSR